MRLEYIYVLFCFDFPLRGKVGVSTDVESRRLDIQSDLRSILSRDVTVRILWKMPVLTSAYDFETAIHRVLRPLHCSSVPGSGRTEWFWAPNIVTAIVALLLMYGYDASAPGIRALFILFIPVPLDFALCVTLLALVEYSIAVAILIFGWRLLQTLLQVAFL